MRRRILPFLVPAFLLLGIAVAHAGSLTPSAAPAATSYTLIDIYTRLTTNAEATEADHDFAPSGLPAASMYTFTEVYDAIPTIDAAKVLSGTTYLGVAGTMTGACLTSTFDGTANLVPDANDGSGNGTNRFCMTNSGDALAGDILSGKVAWVDGLEVTGTIATQTLSAANDTVSAGYYAATTLSAVDADLAAANIKSGITLFGVAGSYSAAGTDLSDMWNGTSGSFTGGTLEFGGIDDYNNGGAPPVDRYSATWTTCDSGNSYCGTGDSGAALKDENTGLVWSKTMNSTTYALDDSAGTMTWFKAYNCAQTSGSTCTKLTSSKTGCEANTGWYLPHQKQLMQAWIDGAYGNLEPSGSSRTHWSATTLSTSATNAWRVTLGQGAVGASNKTSSSVVRCVRPA